MAISQGFRQNQRLEYDPKGGDFLQEQRLTLLAKPLPYLCGDKRRLCRVRRVKVKRSTGRETEGSASGTLTALPGLGIPKTGCHPGNVCACTCVAPARVRKLQTGRQRLPTSLREKSAVHGDLYLVTPIGYGRTPRAADFSRRPTRCGSFHAPSGWEMTLLFVFHSDNSLIQTAQTLSR